LTVDLGRDRRQATDVGRHARLELVFARRDGRTVLADAYAEPPFRVGRCFPEGDGLHMILASSAPGIFDGDSFEQVMRIERGAHVRLTSQSALQIHPSAAAAAHDACSAQLSSSRHESAGHCAFLSSYHVADSATLHCHWDPLIPFANARFSQRIDVRLSESARLYWSDAFMCGRAFAALGRTLGVRPPRGSGDAGVGTGEHWAFASFAHEFLVTRGETLEYLERYRLVPEEGRVTHPWVGGDACYFGTTLVSGATIDALDVERLQAGLAARPGLRAATDAVTPKLLIVRAMCRSGVSFHEARELIGSRFARSSFP
jgi:urease accessory protein UreH